MKQGLDYREGEELSWCPFWCNSLGQEWSCGLVDWPDGNATEPIWWVLASSLGISSWTPLKPQQSNPNPNPLANKLWCFDFLTPPISLIIPHRLPALLESLNALKDWCSIHAICSQSSLKHCIRFCGIFPSLKQNSIVYRSSKVSSRPDCIFEIYQLWKSNFSRLYSNCRCRCSFDSEIIKVGQSSHKMYSNNILNFQESTTILNVCTKNLETYWMYCVIFNSSTVNILSCFYSSTKGYSHSNNKVSGIFLRHCVWSFLFHLVFHLLSISFFAPGYWTQPLNAT